MAEIKVKNKDHVHAQVIADPSVAQELNDYFTFEAPGAKFHPLYKSKVWDGKIRLYSMFTRELYVGLLPYVDHFAKQNEYTVDYSDYVQSADAVTLELVEKFCKSLNLTSRGEPIQIRDYQIDAVYQAIKDGRRLLLSPTSSGKSLIIYCLIRWNQRFNRRQLVIVPTTSLVEQMYSDFGDYSAEDDTWSVNENCHRIYGGHEKSNQYPVVISTWQSIYKLPKAFFSTFKCVYGDEAHNFKAKSLTTILAKCLDTPYRVGTTGTLDGTKTHKLVLEGVFGPVYKVTTTKQLMDTGQVAELKIKFLVLNYSEEIRKANKKLTYQEEMDFLVQYAPRNKFIRNLSVACKGNTLVLFQYVEKHGKVLFDLINNKVEEGRKVFFVSGATETEDREAIRAITEKETNAIIVASYGTFSTGINIRQLHNVIFASPTKSRIRNLQSIGRGLRLGKDKTSCQLFDIGDDMSWKSHKNYTLEHLMERIKTYNEEHFEYKITNVELTERKPEVF